MIGAVGIARNLAEQTDFGYMLSLGTIHFEDNYCASKSVEQPWLALAAPC